MQAQNFLRGQLLSSGVIAVKRSQPGKWLGDIAPAIEFASITGWRIGEIRGLTWAQVDVKGCVVRLEPGTTKND